MEKRVTLALFQSVSSGSNAAGVVVSDNTQHLKQSDRGKLNTKTLFFFAKKSEILLILMFCVICSDAETLFFPEVSRNVHQCLTVSRLLGWLGNFSSNWLRMPSLRECVSVGEVDLPPSVK